MTSGIGCIYKTQTGCVEDRPCFAKSSPAAVEARKHGLTSRGDPPGVRTSTVPFVVLA